MGLRRPSSALVVDTNIVVGAILGAGRRAVWKRLNSQRQLLISVEGIAEVMSVVSHARHRVPYAIEDATALLEFFDPTPTERYESLLAQAANTLRDAVPSRNGSTTDAHILALAWACEADIWSHDRDFAGTGWPSWSSANLAAALSKEAEASDVRPS